MIPTVCAAPAIVIHRKKHALAALQCAVFALFGMCQLSLAHADELPDAAANALIPPVASGPGEASDRPGLRIETTPPGVSFKIFAGAYETVNAEAIRSGLTPITISDLRPGAYRVVLNPSGVSSRSASVQVPAKGTVVFERELPHGFLKLRSQPSGAELVCDGRMIGLAPAILPVMPGRHEVFARWKGRKSRPRIVQIADASEKTLSFDFRTSSKSSKSTPSVPQEVEQDSLLKKVGRTVKKMVNKVW